jgi:hypothetical protein
MVEVGLLTDKEPLPKIYCPMCGAEAVIWGQYSHTAEVGDENAPWKMRAVLKGFPDDILDHTEVINTDIKCKKCKYDTDFEARRIIKKGKNRPLGIYVAGSF